MTHNHKRSASRPRHGFSLIELLIVCTVTGVLSVTGVVTIGMLMSAEGRGAESLVRQTTIARLGAHFRDDVHATNEASVENVDGSEQNQLVLRQIDESTITYQITETGVDRHVAGGANDGHRERFRLPESRAQFESSSENQIVRLVIQAPRQLLSEVAAGELPPHALDRIEIEAALAWDFRHSHPEHSTGDSEE